MAQSLIPEMYIDVHITMRCQLRCKHCYLSKHREDSDMDFYFFQWLVREYRKMLHPLQKRRVILSGGEPTKHKHFENFCLWLDDISMPYSIATNGQDYKKLKNVSEFLNHASVQVSIDGAEKTHNLIRGEGTHKKALNTLYYLTSQLPHVKHSISYTISQETISDEDVSYIMQLAKDTNSSLNINYYSGFGQLKQVSLCEYNRVRQKFKDAGFDISTPCIIKKTKYGIGDCIGGKTGVSILPDGTIWDCTRSQNMIGVYGDITLAEAFFWPLIVSETIVEPRCHREGCNNVSH